MVDKISTQSRSKIMAAIRSNDTKPEIQLRQALWKEGLRYRTNFGPERIDIAFPAKRLAIFVDGCFWHSCPMHSHVPKSNISYWGPKLKKNVDRDKAKEARLFACNWRIVRVWEHDLRNIDEVISRIMAALGEG